MYEKISNKRVRNLNIFYIEDNKITVYPTPYLKYESKIIINQYIKNK